MALPTLSSVQPAAGPSSGGDLVRLVGTDLADRVRVLFGGERAEVLSVRDETGLRVVDLRTPIHAVGVVDVELSNLDAAGDPIPELRSYIRRKIEMARDFPRESRLFANEMLQGAPHAIDVLAGELTPL